MWMVVGVLDVSQLDRYEIIRGCSCVLVVCVRPCVLAGYCESYCDVIVAVIVVLL